MTYENFAVLAYKEVQGESGDDVATGKFNIGFGFESQTIMPNVVIADKDDDIIVVDLPGMFDERKVKKVGYDID